jgi:hypothetical protein
MGGVFNVVNLHTYHYAGNNPVKLSDPDGRMPFLVVTGAIGAVAGAIVGGAYGAYKSYSESGEIDWREVGKDALIGGAAGGLVGVGAGAGAAKLLAGSYVASTSAVAFGTKIFVAGISTTGFASFDAFK